MSQIVKFAAAALAASALPAGAFAQAEAPTRKAIPFLPIANEAPPKLAVDQPLAGPLADRAVVIIPYRMENFRILPVFGASSVDVSPRAGHLHVSVDDSPWRWADAGNNDAIVIVGLSPGSHEVLIELATPVHKVLASKSVSFTVPRVEH